MENTEPLAILTEEVPPQERTFNRRNLEPHPLRSYKAACIFSTPTKPTPSLIALCQKLTG